MPRTVCKPVAAHMSRGKMPFKAPSRVQLLLLSSCAALCLVVALQVLGSPDPQLAGRRAVAARKLGAGDVDADAELSVSEA